MLIRYFERDDKDVFKRLCKEFYDCHATLRDYDDAITEKTFARIMDHHENLWGLLMSAAETGEALGYGLITSYWSNEDGGEVIVMDELYIRPSERHKGYAKIFMQWLEDAYRDEASSITLEVLSSNQAARDLYARMGYVPDGFVTYTKKIG
jgi:GNAT superfamily N-acetyltransferase